MIIRDHRDAAAAAVESNARRAEPCAGCGMPKGSGLGSHYLGCPIDTAERAKAEAERAS